MNKEELAAIFTGGMLGTALGDAIGELAFRHRKKDELYEAIDRAPLLQYTDDTAMAIGIAEVLLQNKDLDADSLGNRFKENFEKEPGRGYGPGPLGVFTLVEQGYSYTQAAGMLFEGKGSFGNGAAMRITPVGLYFYDSSHLVQKAYITAEVTHIHPLGKEGAAVLAKAIALAVKGKDKENPSVKEFCKELISVARTKEFFKQLSAVRTLLSTNSSRTEAARILGTNLTAIGSVPFAIFSFLKNRDSFVDCLLDAVLAGGDRDTIGAMACAISGAYLGREKLPRGWVGKLENASYIQGLAMKLADLKYSL